MAPHGSAIVGHRDHQRRNPVRGFPFSDDVRAFLDAHEVTFVVEQNRDAQLRSMLLLETGVAPEKMESVRYYGGFPMSAHHVISGVKARLEKAA